MKSSKKFWLSICITLLSLQTAMAESVSRDEAAGIAARFLSEHNLSATLNTSNVHRSPRRSASTQADAYYYIFNVSDDQGFVIVSGDDRTEEIIGYSDKGHFDENRIPVNMQSWLKECERQIQWLDDNNITISQSARRRADSTEGTATRAAIAPLVTSIWDQEAPFNNNCPSLTNYSGYDASTTLTGCVATGMAQVMYYNKWPKTETATIPSYTMSYTYYNSNWAASTKTMSMSSLSATTFDWDNMIDDYTGSYTDAQGAAVAKLMQYCGYSVEMSYGTSIVGGSGAYTSDVAKALVKYFGYDAETVAYKSRSSYTMDEWNELMYNELASGRAIVYCGQSDGGGHCFVCDGYSYDNFFHINWGWSGMCDGYFKLSILNPYGSGSGGSSTSNGFSYSQGAVIGIKPGSGGSYQGTESLSLFSLLSISSAYNTYNVTVQPWNLTSENVTVYEVALAVYNEDGTATGTVVGNSTTNTTLNAGGYYFTVTCSLSSSSLTTNGTYRLLPVYKTSSNGSWTLFEDSPNNYVKVVVSNHKISSAAVYPNPSMLTVNSATHNGDAIISHSQCLTYSITNKSDSEDYNGKLYLFVKNTSSSSGGKQGGGSSSSTTYYQLATNGVYIPAGETVDVEMYFDGYYNYSSSNYGYISSGSKTMILSSDDACSNQIYSSTLTLSSSGSATSLSNIELTSVTFDADYTSGTATSTSGTTYTTYTVYGGSTINATFTATNTNSSAYDAEALLYLYTWSDADNSYIYTTGSEQTIHVAANSTATLTASFDGLSAGNEYIIVPYYYYSSSAYTSFNRTILYFENGLETWTADGTHAGTNASGDITIPDGAVAVSLKGLNISSITPNSNPNTLYFFGSDGNVPSALSGKNVVKGNEAESITLTAGYSYYSPYDFTANSISYTRKFANGHGNTTDTTDEQKKAGWSTITLPFAPTSIATSSKQLDWFRSDEGSGNFWLFDFGAEDYDNSTVYFTYTDEFEANHPYLIAVPGDKWGTNWNLTNKDIVFSATGAKVISGQKPVVSTNAKNYKFVGNYASDVTYSDIYLLNSAGSSFTKQSSTTAAPFEAYFLIGNPLLYATAPTLSFGMMNGNQITGIDDVTVDSEQAEESVVYNLDGTRTKADNLRRGVYITAGKKILVR